MVCSYITNRVQLTDISLENYVSTDNLLQNCEGVVSYDGIPNIGSVMEYKDGDILLSNIRPYLKKLWLADRDGGCNPDVLVLRVVDENVSSEFVYNYLRRQSFFDYVMQDVKGMKMPRGNKEHIMRYEIPIVTIEEQRKMLQEIKLYEQIIEENKRVMQSCDARKKEILVKYLD